MHLAMLGAIVAATWARVAPWVRVFVPLASVGFLYTELPALIAAAGHMTLLDATVVGWEATVFGGHPALEWAARWPNRALSELLHFAYVAYYPIIFSVPLVLLWQRRHDELARAVFVLLLTFVACFATYVGFPVAGPRYLATSPGESIGGVMRSVATFLLESQSSRGTAFPSSHVAVATTQSVIAFVFFGRRGLVVGLLTVLLGLGAVYGGFHYLIDVVAGAAYGLALAALGFAALRVRARQANASAPT
jgi:membrane-associated phospholipid phosphatase